MGVMYCHATLRQWYPPGMLEFQFSGPISLEAAEVNLLPFHDKRG